MSTSAMMVTIPSVKLTLDELLIVIRQLDEPARVRVAQALLETQMDANLTGFIEQLATITPINDLSDADIAAEIKSVRQTQM